jgi:hypothetical protein
VVFARSVLERSGCEEDFGHSNERNGEICTAVRGK